MRLYSIKGKEIWLLTLTELAKITGVKTKTLRKWEKMGILPKAVVVEPMHSPILGECGRRLYTEEQAKVMAQWMARVKPGRGVHIKDSFIVMLHERWKEVTEQFKKSLNNGENV